MVDTRTLIDDNHRIINTALTTLVDLDMDYPVRPGAKTSGEDLLHIAAFEYIYVASIAITKGRSINSTLWYNDVKFGFAREAGFLPLPSGYPVSYYQTVLDKVRNYTMTIIDPMDSFLVSSINLTPLMIQLSSGDPTAPPSSYLIIPFQAAQSAVYHDVGNDLGAMMVSHAAYHRGEIFLRRWLRNNP